MGFEVVDFVPTTRRWYDRGKPREMQGKWDACQSLSLRDYGNIVPFLIPENWP